jgi:flagellar biosynthesis/type III secretory pathway M-ring protein FliF/YscJ
MCCMSRWLWSKEPDYKVLFSNYSDRDGGAITASLDQMGVKYKFSEGGTAILVPAEQVHERAPEAGRARPAAAATSASS